jgi:hypothetical protein
MMIGIMEYHDGFAFSFFSFISLSFFFYYYYYFYFLHFYDTTNNHLHDHHQKDRIHTLATERGTGRKRDRKNSGQGMMIHTLCYDTHTHTWLGRPGLRRFTNFCILMIT